MGLLFGSAGDHQGALVDPRGVLGDLAQGVVGGLGLVEHLPGALVVLAHRGHRGVGALADAGDHAFDLMGRLLGAVGEGAHFVGDHRESAALLAGAGGLDGGIEGEEVGLLGDGADHVEHLADVLRLAGQAFHQARGLADLGVHLADRADGLSDPCAAVAGGPFRETGGLGGGAGVARDLLDRRAHFVDRGGGHLDLIVLPGQRPVAFLGHRVQLLGSGGQQRGGIADLLDGVVQAGLHAAHGLHQLRRLVVAVAGDLAGQVAGRDAVGAGHRLADRHDDAAGQQPGDRHAGRQGHQQHREDRGGGPGVDIGGFGGGGAGGLAVEGDELLQGPLHLLVALQLGPAHQHAGFVGTVVTGQREQGGVSFEVFLLALDELVEQRALLVQDQQGAVFPFHPGEGSDDLVHPLFLLAHARGVVQQHVVHLAEAQFAHQAAELGRGFDAGQPDLADILGGAVQRTHAVVREEAERHQQRGEDGEADDGAWGDGDTTKKHGVVSDWAVGRCLVL
ncbi:hypothetical protein PA99_1985 [Pseudomonas aeruginosa PA99]|nr:hypothetical protein PA99_1985 [Pseudomonas aeruginosa PA99]